MVVLARGGSSLDDANMYRVILIFVCYRTRFIDGEIVLP
jgi:hypothetical protein